MNIFEERTKAKELPGPSSSSSEKMVGMKSYADDFDRCSMYRNSLKI
jgi:hypothetical protein